MNRAALAASKPPDRYSLFLTVFRPYQSFHIVVVFKLPSALRADRFVITNHMVSLFSN